MEKKTRLIARDDMFEFPEQWKAHNLPPFELVYHGPP
jgi:hypothetical protein